MHKNLIYALLEHDTKEIKYIGKTTIGLRRPKEHLQIRRVQRRPNSKLNNWLINRISKNKKPVIKILLSFDTISNEKLYLIEQQIIKHYRQFCDLKNTSDGGAGLVNPSKEIREKIARAWLGRHHTEKTKELKRNINPTSKKVIRNDGVIFRSCTEGAIAIGSRREAVRDNCKGKIKSTKGYSFKYYLGES